jgi:hypothetical protein
MKKNYMYQLYWCLILTTALFLKTNAQSPGDVVFVAFNTDGDGDLAMVTLVDLTANTTIYITDNESDGVGGITSGEGTLVWFTDNTTIKAGTIIIFTDVENATSPNFGVSIGTLSRTGRFNISSSKDGIIAFLGTDNSSPTSFITAIQIGNEPAELGPFDADGVTLTNTGLATNSSIVVIDNSASPDGAVYNASRSSKTSYNNYYSLLSDNNSNWTNIINGDGETLLPFSSKAFTINTTNWTGVESSVWNLSENWDNGIPTSNSLATVPDVVILPMIGSGNNAFAGNLRIDTGARLTINSANSASISGLLAVNGALHMNSGSSLIIDGTSIGNITYHRTLATNNWYLVSAPLEGETIDNLILNHSFAMGTAPNIGVSTYTSSNDTWNYMTATSTGEIISGKGYAVKLASSGPLSFTGTIKEEDTSIVLTTSGNGFNLLGNPYTSYINSSAVLTNSTSALTSQTLWIWDESNNRYDTKVTADAFKIAPGQGFFVQSNGTAGVIQIDEDDQSHEASDTFQKTATRAEIHLTLSNGSVSSAAKIYYIDNTTTGFDNGYDGPLFGGTANDFAIYTKAVDDTTEQALAIQSLPNIHFENRVIPVGVHATAGEEITFTTATLNVPIAIKVFLEDRFTNTFTHLDETNSEYKVTLTESLNGVGRFYLHTARNVLSTENVLLNSIHLYKTDAATLKITGLPQGKTGFYLYNILGKEMMTVLFQSNGNEEISLSKLASGIYFVKIQTEKGAITKKIILE